MRYSGSPLRGRWRHIFAITIVASLTMAAGCSTNGGGSTREAVGELTPAQTECVEAADAFIANRGGELPSDLPPELVPLSKAPNRGLTLTTMFVGSDPTSSAGADYVIEAAEAVGWTATKLAHNGTVEDLNDKAIQAVRSSDVVNIIGFPPASLQPAIAAAKAGGVLLMLSSVQEAPQSVPGYGSNPIGGNFWPKLGELAAYKYLSANGCQGKAVTFALPFEAVLSVGQSFKSTVEAQCDDCTVENVELNGSDVGTPAMTNTIVSKMQADPDLDFAFFTSGSITAGVEPALRQAGVDVGIAGALPVNQNLQALEKGDNEFWVDTPLDVFGWTIVDSAVRALDSGQPWNSEYFPAPIFTTDNLESVDPVPAYPADFRDQFLELWQTN